MRSPFFTRRQFIGASIISIIAAWVGAFVQSKFFPPASAAQAAPVELSLAEIPIGGAKQITYAGAPALVVRSPDGLLALSLVCPHLGCLVRWQADAKQFYCPCHEGKFDEFGDVLAGPPPLPLERLPAKLSGDKVLVGVAL